MGNGELQIRKSVMKININTCKQNDRMQVMSTEILCKDLYMICTVFFKCITYKSKHPHPIGFNLNIAINTDTDVYLFDT